MIISLLLKFHEIFVLNEKIIEMNYSNVCLVNFSVAELILRRLKTKHKQFYWNKILKVYSFAVNISNATSNSSDDTVLFNEIIIHNSSQNTVKVFFKLIQSYFILWNNHDFAIRLHKNYNIFVTTILKKKFSQQYVDFFQIIQRIENLVYKLKIFDNWRI